ARGAERRHDPQMAKIGNQMAKPGRTRFPVRRRCLLSGRWRGCLDRDLSSCRQIDHRTRTDGLSKANGDHIATGWSRLALRLSRGDSDLDGEGGFSCVDLVWLAVARCDVDPDETLIGTGDSHALQLHVGR
ncbi:hypothetical protein ACFUC1_20190, partial [Pedococcus sp. NPDC057267]|uniref:hypothetical protein n=1 Tax=Pedococcus sp. NPDC057267 TaxID=3346077 RepID=UPI003640BAEB